MLNSNLYNILVIAGIIFAALVIICGDDGGDCDCVADDFAWNARESMAGRAENSVKRKARISRLFCI